VSNTVCLSSRPKIREIWSMVGRVLLKGGK
jgi:hypothetical protein